MPNAALKIHSEENGLLLRRPIEYSFEFSRSQNHVERERYPFLDVSSSRISSSVSTGDKADLEELHARVTALEQEFLELKRRESSPPLSHSDMPLCATVTADMYIPAGTGFHDLEYDGMGTPFRWTGPGMDFSLNCLIDRSVAVEFELYLPFASAKVSPSGIICLVDGREGKIRAQQEGVGWVLTGTAPPRDPPCVSEFRFVTPGTDLSGGRRIGCAFGRFVARCIPR